MIRVAIVDDHPLLREGIRHLLEGQPDMEVVGEAGDGEEAMRLVLESKPDVVLMDISMPRLDGLEATRRIKEQRPETKVLILTIHDEEEYTEGLLKEGADGYLLKSTYGPSLVEAVRLASLGEMVLDAKVGKDLLRRWPALKTGQGDTGGVGPNAFTVKQLQVLRWMAKGMTSAEMAKLMGVSERTVKGYVARVFDKLGVGSRSAAVAAAVRQGVLKGDDL